MNEHSSDTRATVPPSATDSGTQKLVKKLLDFAETFDAPVANIMREAADEITRLDRALGYERVDVPHIERELWKEAVERERVLAKALTEILNIARHTKTTYHHPLIVRTDSALSAKGINPDVADQGSVRNATDMRERCAKVALDAAEHWRKDSRDMQAEGKPERGYLHLNALASGAEIVWGRIRALPDQKD